MRRHVRQKQALENLHFGTAIYNALDLDGDGKARKKFCLTVTLRCGLHAGVTYGIRYCLLLKSRTLHV